MFCCSHSVGEPKRPCSTSELWTGSPTSSANPRIQAHMTNATAATGHQIKTPRRRLCPNAALVRGSVNFVAIRRSLDGSNPVLEPIPTAPALNETIISTFKGAGTYVRTPPANSCSLLKRAAGSARFEVDAVANIGGHRTHCSADNAERDDSDDGSRGQDLIEYALLGEIGRAHV